PIENNQQQPASSTQSQPERQKPDQTKTSNTHPTGQMPQKQKSSISKNTWTHDAKQMASDNPSTHYRVLKEHTPTSTTP
ncbi:hypothetical protein, partial [Gordonia aquimaris]